MRNKNLLKLTIVGYNLNVNILYKRIFSLWFFHFDYNPKADNERVFLILKVNQGPKVGLFLNDFLERQRTRV